MLNFKTPENMSPIRLPKVYFCGTPKDIKNYLDYIANAIWSTHACTVFYNEDNGSEVILEELRDMQLLVFIINKELLFDKDSVIWAQLDYAIKNGIAVLPILENKQFSEELNKRYNTLHCLELTDLSTQSGRFISFLNMVLLGKEYAEIEKYLRARLFLSYRKTDRRFVRELMRIIHKNKRLLDVGFWYDEYLVPGEEFNQAIEKALLECDAFILTITSEIAEKRKLDNGETEDNYVVKFEYKTASKNHKRIFPIVMESVDEEKLSVFKNLPAVISAGDEENIWAAIESYLEVELKKDSKVFPERDYYLGLAYLNGVGVEVDRDCAVELITESAEQGVLRAVSRLVNMYKNGIGVPPDRETAVFWQEKKTKSLAEAFRLMGGDKALCNLLNAYIELGDLYIDISKRREAKNAFKTALEKAESFKPQTSNIIAVLATCHQRLGRLYLAHDNQDKRGVKHMSEYVKIRKTIWEQNDDSDPVWYADSLMREADALSVNGDFENAIAVYKRALGVLEGNKKAENNPNVSLLCAIIKDHIASVYMDLAKTKESAAYFVDALELYKKRVAKYHSIESRRGLAFAYNNLGGVCNMCGDKEHGIELVQKSLGLLEELVKETDMAYLKNHLLGVYTNAVTGLSDLAADFNSTEKQKSDKYISTAKEYIDRATEILESIKNILTPNEYKMAEALRLRSLGNYDTALCKIEGEISFIVDIPVVAFAGAYKESMDMLAELCEQHYPRALTEYFRCVLRFTGAFYSFKSYDYCKPIYVEAIDFLAGFAAKERTFSEYLFILRVELMYDYARKILKSDEQKEYLIKTLNMFNTVPGKYQHSSQIISHKQNIEELIKLY